MTEVAVAGSFRDPSGFVFQDGDEFFRQVNSVYREHYEHLMKSGLYEALVRGALLISHEDIGLSKAQNPAAYTVLHPRRIPLVSYPYEWSFGQLRDAALLTLAVQKKAFEFGMTLKDASAYNVQFLEGRPIFIDTLSFELYRPGQVWVPYRQFCQHFLAPLALVAYRDARLQRLLRLYMDGIPLDIASKLLPLRSRAVPGLFMHLHLHARAQQHWGGAARRPTRQMGRTAFQGLISSLEGAVRRLRWRPGGTEWAEYYDATNYSETAFEAKKAIVREFLERARPGSVWDLGANTGLFSSIAADMGASVVSFDVDPACVERNYLECKERGEKRILPLLLDLTNPSPSLGWAQVERESIADRGPADLVMALALVHHLAIGNNVPLREIGRLFARLGRDLVIEFVGKEDSQVQRLLASREDIFPNYTREGFEAEFGRFFEILSIRQPPGTSRILYLMRRRAG